KVENQADVSFASIQTSLSSSLSESSESVNSIATLLANIDATSFKGTFLLVLSFSDFSTFLNEAEEVVVVVRHWVTFLLNAIN
uniref:Uncharacterized protein n=1 Tax=Megaselia scalaris TaxID=36166 RepID=T1H715_MEGSC